MKRTDVSNHERRYLDLGTSRIICKGVSTVATGLLNIQCLTDTAVRIGTLLITLARFPNRINSTGMPTLEKEIWNSSNFFSRPSHTFFGRRKLGSKENLGLLNEY